MSGGFENADALDKARLVDNFLDYLKYYDYSREWAILGLSDSSGGSDALMQEQEEFAASFKPVLIFLWRQALGFIFGDLSTEIYNLFMARFEQGRELDEIFALRESIDSVSQLGDNDHGMILIALRCVNLVNPDAEDKNDMIVSFTERLLHLLERFAKPDNGITELEIETLRVRHATRRRELEAFKAREEEVMSLGDSPLDMSGLELEEIGADTAPAGPKERTGKAGKDVAPEAPATEEQPAAEAKPGSGLKGAPAAEKDTDADGYEDRGGGLGNFLEEQRDALRLEGEGQPEGEVEAKPSEPAPPQGFREMVDGVFGIAWNTKKDSLERNDLEFVKNCDKTGVTVLSKGSGYLFFTDQGLIQSTRKYKGVDFARQLDYLKEVFEFRGNKDGIDYYRLGDVIAKVDKKTAKISTIRKQRKKVGKPAISPRGKGAASERIVLGGADPEGGSKSMLDGDSRGEADALPTPSVLGEKTFLQAFIISFYKAKGVNNWIAQNIGFYDDQVDYLSRGVIPKKDIASEYLATQQNWPDRSYQVNGDLVITPTDIPGVSDVEVPYSYTLKNRKEDVSGNAKAILRIKVANEKGFIMAEKEA